MNVKRPHGSNLYAGAHSPLATTVAATEAERTRNEASAATAARNDLRNRLNAALPTRESSRGLISEIGGVQFSTGAAVLNESARENLAKLSGIVASYPTMRFNVEGHTDSTGVSRPTTRSRCSARCPSAIT